MIFCSVFLDSIVLDCLIVFMPQHLPGRFVMKHFGQRDDFYPILSLPCGRFWIVQYRFKMVRGAPVARFQFGWNLFIEDNKLIVGDVCIFELVDSVNVQFKVTIFRAAEDKNFGPFPGELMSNFFSGLYSPSEFGHRRNV